MQNIAGVVLPGLSERQALRRNTARWLPMIDPALLTRLREADPETWERIARGIPLKPCGQYFAFDNGKITACQYKEAYIPIGELLPEVAEAWLQHVLQDAIRARGWHLRQLQYSDGDCYACIAEGENLNIIANEEGNLPASALSRAYLAATEAQP